MKKTFTFVGSSLTRGVGLIGEDNNPNNYSKLVSDYYDATVKNLSSAGNPVDNVFLSALHEILFSPPDVIFVKFNLFHRYRVSPAPGIHLSALYRDESFTYRDMVISARNFRKFTEMYELLNHDYEFLFKIIRYVNILEKAAESKCKIFFINGYIPWTPDLFTIDSLNNMHDNFSCFTKDLLEFDNSTDDEIKANFLRLHNELMAMNQQAWVNLFSQLVGKHQIDNGTDDTHPGEETHKKLAQLIIDGLQGKI